MSYILILLSAVFFESVKSELRNGSSEYSDISDSEESEPDCTTQVHLEKKISEINGAIKYNVAHVLKIYLVKVGIKAAMTKHSVLVQTNISNNVLFHSSFILVLRKKDKIRCLAKFYLWSLRWVWRRMSPALEQAKSEKSQVLVTLFISITNLNFIIQIMRI